MIAYRRYANTLRYLFRHKWFVFQECLKLGVPIWIAILHDWDKLLPGYWIPVARAFRDPDGKRWHQPTDASKKAWLFHQNRNKHHWQYWMITWDRGETECFPMPDVYRREMLADWRGAGKALGFPDTLAWYTENRGNIQLHPETRQFVDATLGHITSYCDHCGKIIHGDGAAKARYAEGIFCSADCADSADMPHTSINHYRRNKAHEGY